MVIYLGGDSVFKPQMLGYIRPTLRAVIRKRFRF